MLVKAANCSSSPHFLSLLLHLGDFEALYYRLVSIGVCKRKIIWMCTYEYISVSIVSLCVMSAACPRCTTDVFICMTHIFHHLVRQALHQSWCNHHTHAAKTLSHTRTHCDLSRHLVTGVTSQTWLQWILITVLLLKRGEWKIIYAGKHKLPVVCWR